MTQAILAQVCKKLYAIPPMLYNSNAGNSMGCGMLVNAMLVINSE